MLNITSFRFLLVAGFVFCLLFHLSTKPICALTPTNNAKLMRKFCQNPRLHKIIASNKSNQKSPQSSFLQADLIKNRKTFIANESIEMEVKSTNRTKRIEKLAKLKEKYCDNNTSESGLDDIIQQLRLERNNRASLFHRLFEIFGRLNFFKQ